MFISVRFGGWNWVQLKPYFVIDMFALTVFYCILLQYTNTCNVITEPREFQWYPYWAPASPWVQLTQGPLWYCRGRRPAGACHMTSWCCIDLYFLVWDLVRSRSCLKSWTASAGCDRWVELRFLHPGLHWLQQTAYTQLELHIQSSF